MSLSSKWVLLNGSTGHSSGGKRMEVETMLITSPSFSKKKSFSYEAVLNEQESVSRYPFGRVSHSWAHLEDSEKKLHIFWMHEPNRGVGSGCTVRIQYVYVHSTYIRHHTLCMLLWDAKKWWKSQENRVFLVLSAHFTFSKIRSLSKTSLSLIKFNDNNKG